LFFTGFQLCYAISVALATTDIRVAHRVPSVTTRLLGVATLIRTQERKPRRIPPHPLPGFFFALEKAGFPNF
jgi:hypothetical protein